MLAAGDDPEVLLFSALATISPGTTRFAQGRQCLQKENRLSPDRAARIDPVTSLYQTARPTRHEKRRRASPGHAALDWPDMPEIAWIRSSSVTVSAGNSRVMRPLCMAMIRSATCSTSGISEETTITA